MGIRSASLMLPEVIPTRYSRRSLDWAAKWRRSPANAEVKRQGGAIGVFTDGQLSRTSVYHQALLLALVPFHNAIYQL